jgi:hypothetical protein
MIAFQGLFDLDHFVPAKPERHSAPAIVEALFDLIPF